MPAPPIPRLILLLGLLLASPALAAAPVDPVGTLLTQAREAQDQGNIELALRLAQSAIVADPARAGSYVALGNIYADAGQRDYARTYYNEALSINPAEPSALQAVAVLDRKPPNVAVTP